MVNPKKQGLPPLHPTPLTWGYVAFAVVVVALTVWGLVVAAQP